MMISGGLKFKRLISLSIFLYITLSLYHAYADIETVEDQEAQYKYKITIPPEGPLKKPASVKELSTDLTASVSQGVDTNPLLDSTHKADNYNQENVDMRFRYDLPDNSLGEVGSRFGLNVMNINYYRVTDVNIFDGLADVNIDQDISKEIKLSAGYQFEIMWYPNNETGNYVGDQINFSIKHTLSKSLYQFFIYKLTFRNYLERKIMLGNGNLGSPLRFDIRNNLRYEIGFFPIKTVKFKAINDFYINDSNDQYYDYYSYKANRTGISVIALLSKKLSGTAAFYYQRKWYDSRVVSCGNYFQRDNLYTAVATLIYDINKNLSLFGSYSHMENHTNEPLERYSDTLYSFGVNYNF